MKKSNLDRRDLLKGLLAVPGVAALGGLVSSCNKDAENAQPKTAVDIKTVTPKTAASATTISFNLVLHGTYALQFDTQNKQLQILIPEVLDSSGTEAHQYLSGMYLVETPIMASAAVIAFGLPLNANNPLPDVVTKTPTTEDPTKFVILRKADLQQNPSGSLRNKLQLPYPRSLKVLRAQELKDPSKHKFFDNASLIPKTPTQMPLCLALQYDLSVDGTFPNWSPSIHYHVFAEPVKKPGQMHITTAFSALTNLYTDVGNLSMSQEILDDVDKPPSLALVKDVPIKLPNDFIPGEEASLEKRAGLPLPVGASHVGSCANLILVSGPDA
jgi:hypothetical protein